MNSDSSPDRTKDKPPARRRLAGGLVLAMLASLLLMLSPLPYSMLSGVTGLVALVLLIPLIVRSFRERRYSMAVISALLGVPATLMVVVGAAVSVVFYGPMAELEQCRSTAITEQARIQCEDAVLDSTAQWVSDLFGG
ncbi:MAG: hypothetical protein ACTHWF_07505 [Brachybacterium sp.]